MRRLPLSPKPRRGCTTSLGPLEIPWKGFGIAEAWPPPVVRTVELRPTGPATPDAVDEAALETQRQSILEQLIALGDLRPRSLVEVIAQLPLRSVGGRVRVKKKAA